MSLNFFQAIHDCLEEKKEKILSAMREESVKSRALLQRQEKLYQFAVLMLTTKCWGCRPQEIIRHDRNNEVKKEIQAYCVSERKPLKINFVKALESLDILIKAKGMGFLQLQSDTIANQSLAEGSGTKEATVWLRAEFTLTKKNSGGDPCYNKMG